MQEINVFEHAEAILKQLSKGAFLNTAANGAQNTMTIGWGQLGFQWGVPTFAELDISDTANCFRYYAGLITKPEGGIIPVNDGFQKALGICGTKSGRDMDKFEAAGLETEMGKTVFAPIVKGCGLQIECEVVETKVMEPEQFDGEMADKWYAAGDWHTYYVGKITAAYLE